MTRRAAIEETTVLGIASWRITRLIVNDTLWSTTRERLLSALANAARHPEDQRPTLRQLAAGKAYELLSCPWCVGVWVSVALVCVHRRRWPWQLRTDDWVTAATVAGVESLCIVAAAVPDV